MTIVSRKVRERIDAGDWAGARALMPKEKPRTAIVRKTPLKSSRSVKSLLAVGKPAHKSARPRPKKRRTASEERAREQRIYGPPGRVEFVKSLGCRVNLLCLGPIENAHVGRRGKGTSRKADYTEILNLCKRHHEECHRGQQSFAARWGLDLEAECAAVERAWGARCEALQISSSPKPEVAP